MEHLTFSGGLNDRKSRGATCTTMQNRLSAATLCLLSGATALPALAQTKSVIHVPAFRVYVASGYQPSERNIKQLQELKQDGALLRLVTFDVSKNNADMLICRGSFPVYAPNKTPFAQMLEAATNLELASSGLADPQAARVQASLDEFDFSSFGSGKWSIRATFTVEGKEPVVVSHQYQFPLAMSAVTSCNNVVTALVPGLEAFLNKLYAEPGFLALFQP